jgi:hypothetical protein
LSGTENVSGINNSSEIQRRPLNICDYETLFSRNVDELAPHYTASCPRRQQYPSSDEISDHSLRAIVSIVLCCVVSGGDKFGLSRKAVS